MVQRRVFILIGGFLSGCVLALLADHERTGIPGCTDRCSRSPNRTAPAFTARQWGDEWNHGFEIA